VPGALHEECGKDVQPKIEAVVLDSLAVVRSRVGTAILPDDSVDVARPFPPRQILDALREPPGFSDIAQPREVSFPRVVSGMDVKSNEYRGDVDEPRFALADDLSVSAVWISSRIFHDSSCHRIEVDIGDDLSIVVLCVDDSRPVAALPESSEKAPSPIEPASHIGLKTQHRTPQRNRISFDNQVIVVAHQTPGEDLPAVEIANVSNDLNEIYSFIWIVEDGFAAGNTAVNVVGGTGDKEAGFSRHGMPPMRGRDLHILRCPPHNATMRRVAPMGPPSGGRRYWNAPKNTKLWWSWAVRPQLKLFEVLSNQPLVASSQD
jgi:hypothetical protein